MHRKIDILCIAVRCPSRVGISRRAPRRRMDPEAEAPWRGAIRGGWVESVRPGQGEQQHCPYRERPSSCRGLCSKCCRGRCPSLSGCESTYQLGLHIHIWPAMLVSRSERGLETWAVIVGMYTYTTNTAGRKMAAGHHHHQAQVCLAQWTRRLRGNGKPLPPLKPAVSGNVQKRHILSLGLATPAID